MNYSNEIDELLKVFGLSETEQGVKANTVNNNNRLRYNTTIDDAETITSEIDVPGFDSNTLEIEVGNDIVKLTGEITTEVGNRKIDTSFRLGKKYIGSNIKAFCENGILTLTIPVSEKMKPKKIKID